LAAITAAGAFIAGIGVASAYQASMGTGSPVPDAVRTTIEKYLGTGGVYEPEAEYLDGVLCYVVTASKNGKPVTVTLSKAGDLQEVATPVRFRDLPEPVQRRLRKDHPTGHFKTVRSVELRLFEVSIPGESARFAYVFPAGNRWLSNMEAEQPSESTDPDADWPWEDEPESDDEG
jgi:hypothetical protein